VGQRVELRRSGSAACPVELAFGLRHAPVPARVTIELLRPGGALARRAQLNLPAEPRRWPVGFSTTPVKLPLGPASPVEGAVITAADGAGRALDVTVIEPLFLERPCP
jgi:hypothetical protein